MCACFERGWNTLCPFKQQRTTRATNTPRSSSLVNINSRVSWPREPQRSTQMSCDATFYCSSKQHQQCTLHTPSTA